MDNENEMLDEYREIFCPMKLMLKDKWDNNRDCEFNNCMAWRWYEPSGPKQRRGYCGLAGKPQYEE